MILRHLREKIVIATIKLLTPNMGYSFEKLYREGIAVNMMPRPMIKYVASLGWKSLVCAEVGVAAGENSKSIIESLDVKRLFAVDPYLDPDDNQNIARRLLANKPVNWYIERSVEAAKRFPVESLDFVYVDAAHDYDNVRADVEAWYPLVKVGGIVGGHDFSLSSHDGLIDAVVEFAKGKELHLFVACPDWWVIKK